MYIQWHSERITEREKISILPLSCNIYKPSQHSWHSTFLPSIDFIHSLLTLPCVHIKHSEKFSFPFSAPALSHSIFFSGWFFVCMFVLGTQNVVIKVKLGNRFFHRIYLLCFNLSLHLFMLYHPAWTMKEFPEFSPQGARQTDLN